MSLRVLGGAAFVAVIAASLGYWAGVRHGSRLGVWTEGAPRGVLATQHLKLLRSGRYEDLENGLEYQVDVSLIWWHHLTEYPLQSALNPLLGSDVIPGLERHVRRLLAYRTEHPSPISNDVMVDSQNHESTERAQYRDTMNQMIKDIESSLSAESGSNNTLQRTRGGSFGEK